MANCDRGPGRHHVSRPPRARSPPPPDARAPTDPADPRARYEVNLEEGEMLFYESAKCMHGRPHPFRGRWYSSLFVHYRPVDWSIDTATIVDAVPPGWMPTDEDMRLDGAALPELQLSTTGFLNPDCADRWCPLADSVLLWGGEANARASQPGLLAGAGIGSSAQLQCAAGAALAFVALWRFGRWRRGHCQKVQHSKRKMCALFDQRVIQCLA